MERMAFDLLFRWFVGLGADEPVWDASTFSKNRERLLEGDVAARFLAVARVLAVLMAQPRVKRLLSSDPFSVDGTMIEAWSSMKSLKPRPEVEQPADGLDREPPPASPSSGGRNVAADFRGDKRSNATHASTTEPEAKLYRKGQGMEARLAFLGHALMENRCGLVVDACLTNADGHAERLAALVMIEKHADRPRAITLGADKGYDTADFVNELRSMNVRPHVAQRLRGSAIDRRTTRHPGYKASQRLRKRIEEAFGGMKTLGGMRRPMRRGTERVGWSFTFAAAAYNLARLPRLLREPVSW